MKVSRRHWSGKGKWALVLGLLSAASLLHLKGIGKWALALGLLYAAWLLLAPTHLGGSTTYLVATGSSMEPDLREGDLVVLRHDDDYEVGDVAGYESATLDRVVVHRIAAEGSDGLVFKGDNNDYLDPERLEEGSLLGRMALHVPRVGRVLVWLREPRIAALVAGLMAVLLTVGSGVRRRARPGEKVVSGFAERLRRQWSSSPGRPAAADLGRSDLLARLSTRADTALLGAVAIAAVSLVLGAWAFGQPTAKTAPWNDLYSHAGSFDYSAKVPARGVYSEGRVRTGDPIFTNVVRRLDVSFAYRLQSTAAREVSGVAGMGAEIRSSTGWKRTLPLNAAVRFAGDDVTVRGKLDLVRLREMTSAMEQTTKTANGTYFVTLKPRVLVRGTVAGQSVDDEFAPELKLRLDTMLLWLEETAGGAALPASLEPTAEGSATRLVPTRLPLPPLEPTVGSVRRGAAAGIVLGLAGMFVFGLALTRRRPLDDHEVIAARLGDLVIDVAPGRGAGRAAVDLVSFEGIARLAETYVLPVLHEQSGEAHTYYVEKDGVLYRFRVGAEPDSAASDEVAPVEPRASEPYAGPDRRSAESAGARFRASALSSDDAGEDSRERPAVKSA